MEKTINDAAAIGRWFDEELSEANAAVEESHHHDEVLDMLGLMVIGRDNVLLMSGIHQDLLEHDYLPSDFFTALYKGGEAWARKQHSRERVVITQEQMIAAIHAFIDFAMRVDPVKLPRRGHAM
jgi:endo-1,4-beta-D-glucanase Y